ncbi:MAG: phosphate/phosphite/phosphonate ABC transporter substrate-binding protein [Gammaproteobacteria bacterium]|nr:phosphate/phosphite/phosphonate ABC transporter substrate-binding protein [Gammaproteobacteria bacterium]
MAFAWQKKGPLRIRKAKNFKEQNIVILAAKKNPDNRNSDRPFTWVSKITLLVLLSLFYTTSQAQSINFIFQPIFSPKRTALSYQILVDYLRETTGLDIKLVTAVNFPSYWETMKKGKEYDIIMDAAHFTEYRAKRQGYTILAKVPDTVSFSLVTGEEELVLDAEELIGRKIASMSSPGLGGIRLAQMFPNPLRQPIILEAANSLAAIENVKKGEAVAALIPTPMLNSVTGLNTVLTTEPVPHVGISASPNVSKEAQKAIKKALIDASKSKKGQKMLEKINFPAFVDANIKTYAGNAVLLDGVWGY